MAASSRAQVLRLYRALLRESQRFSGYNYRTYAIRRIRDAFRENKSIKDSEKIEELVNKAKENLEIIHRQVCIATGDEQEPACCTHKNLYLWRWPTVIVASAEMTHHLTVPTSTGWSPEAFSKHSLHV
uniref:LYR motif containing 4 n=1 Tax=Gallus gallus TaxID=9031 RepID=A0A8V0Y7S8_CHICK